MAIKNNNNKKSKQQWKKKLKSSLLNHEGIVRLIEEKVVVETTWAKERLNIAEDLLKEIAQSHPEIRAPYREVATILGYYDGNELRRRLRRRS